LGKKESYRKVTGPGLSPCKKGAMRGRLSIRAPVWHYNDIN